MQTVEYSLTYDDRDFQRVRQLMHEWCGISLNESKRSLVYNRLARRLKAHQLTSFERYLHLVLDDVAERELFINALTTNLTSFYREEYHFPLLAELLRSLSNQGSVVIWCCASSTGEEPYSIAMTVIEALGVRAAQKVSIVASDIDTQVLSHAASGVYRLDQLKALSKERLKRFFLRGDGRMNGFAMIKPEVKSLIDFRQINLLEPKWPVPNNLDVIFCRNVMIYFDRPTQITILDRFAKLLRQSGRLFLGHSESLNYASHQYELCGRSLYGLVDVKKRGVNHG